MRTASNTTPESPSAIGHAHRARLLEEAPGEERHLPLAGISTCLLEGGQGSPLVLLHGPGEFAAEWARVLPDLVASHRVVAPDLPAHGAPSGGDQRLDTARVLAWLGELIDQTCPEPPGARPAPSVPASAPGVDPHG